MNEKSFRLLIRAFELILVIIANTVSRKVNEISLF